MSFLNFVKKQFIDVIQWTEDDDDTIAWRFPMADGEIQHGASLTVRESQLAVFVNAGRIADVFGPGMYRLSTQTLPVLTYLNNWDKLFESPFKSDVYFFSTRQKLDRKWGTPNPVTVRDKDFGMVRLRAFGIYAFHLNDAKAFHGAVSGTLERYGSEQLEGQLRNTIVAHIADVFGDSGLAFADMAGNQAEFGRALQEKLAPTFRHYGLVLDSFSVENISLPEELQAKLDQRIGVNMLGGMDAYTRLQAAEAIPLAAQNEGGLAGLGAGLGVGLGAGQQLSAAMLQAAGAKAQAAGTADDVVATIEKLHGLLGKGMLTQAEFDAKKAELLKKLG